MPYLEPISPRVIECFIGRFDGLTFAMESPMTRFAPLLFLAACATNAPSGVTSADITCPPNSTLTYENFGQLVIADNCLSCHTSNAHPILDTQAAIQQNKSAILADAVTGTKMPKSNNMVLEDRQLLGEWLACGAP